MPRSLVRFSVSALILGLVLTLAPPPAHLEVHAAPRTLVEELDLELEVAADNAGVAGAAVGSSPARSQRATTAHRFSMVGLQLPDDVDQVLVRTRDHATGTWTRWTELEAIDEDDGPDPGTEEHAFAAGASPTEPLWVGDADGIEVALADGRVADESVRAVLIDSDHLNDGPVDRHVVSRTGPPEADAAPRPSIVSRAGWGADESKRNGSPTTRPGNEVSFGVVHHTAGSNDYSPSQSAAIVRGIYDWHVGRNCGTSQRWGNCWADIGYNILIDRYGRVFEGRAGGLLNGVVGAHAAGYNDGSFGVSVMGNFERVDPPRAAIDALVDVVAWQSAAYGVDPLINYPGRRAGLTRPPASLVGHREVGSTACPGRIQAMLPTIRARASAIAGPFLDVPRGATHEPAIRSLRNRNAISGCTNTTFCPSAQITRGQFASMVVNLARLPRSRAPFSDVPTGYVHNGAIGALANAGIINGYGDGTFRPGEPISRAQAASYLAGVRNLAPGTSHPFRDVPRRSPHFGSVAALHRDGIVSGCTPTSFCANDTLRRDQAASMLQRAF